MQQGGFAGSHFASNLHELHVTQYVISDPGDFSGDGESLEGGGLFRPQTSVLSWHRGLTWSHGTSTGGRRHLIGQRHVPDLREVLLDKR